MSANSKEKSASSKKRKKSDTGSATNGPSLQTKVSHSHNGSLTKKKEKSSEKSEKHVPSSILHGNEVDFPRGGGSGLTPLELRQIHRKVAEDTLFDEKDSNQLTRASKKRKRSSANKTVNDVFEQDKVATLRVESLNFKRLTIGTLIMAQVQSITDTHLVLSLPNQLTGIVDITDISTPLTQKVSKIMDDSDRDDDQEIDDLDLPVLRDMFSIGQWLCAYVRRVEHGDETVKAVKKIVLSINPSLTNSGLKSEEISAGIILNAAVKSLEDHGYILDIGLPKTTGFLSISSADKAGLSDSLQVGQVFQCKISKLSAGNKTAEVEAEIENLALTKMDSAPNVSCLLPGNAVQCSVTGISPRGLLCTFMGIYEGTIDMFHVSTRVYDLDALSAEYPVGKKVRARILYFVPSLEPKRVGLSLQPHILSLDRPKATDKSTKNFIDAFPIGAILENVTVRRVEPGWGVLCQVENVAVNGFTYISRLADDHVTSISESTGPFRVGSSHRARVVGYATVDGLLQLSFEESIINTKYLQVSDVKVGEVVRGTVEAVNAHGVFLALSNTVNGLASPLYLSDVKLSHPELKFKKGDKVKCRILALDETRNRISLTLKKSLVNADVALLKNIEDAKIGMVSVGTIISIKEAGCIVEFFGGVRGYCPNSESANPGMSLMEQYQLGQTVKCVVIQIDPSQNRLRLSFNISKAASSKITESGDYQAVQIGSFVSGRVLYKDGKQLHLQLSESNAEAILHMNHLSDHLGVHCEDLYNAIEVDAEMSDLLVLSNDARRRVIRVTRKPLLLSAARAKGIPEKIGALTLPGKTLPGYVACVSELGVFVSFLGEFNGLAIKHAISDQYVSNLSTLFEVHQTVLAYVQGIDEEKQKLQLNLKPSQISLSDLEYTCEGDFLKSYFEELNEKFTKARVRVGETRMAVVKDTFSYGWLLDLGKGVEGFVTKEQTKGASGEKGDNVVVKVLDYDPTKNIADLSIRPDIFTAEELQAVRSKKKIKPSSETVSKLKSLQDKSKTSEAVVELVKEDYLILRLLNADNQIAFASTKAYNNRSKPFIRYKPEQKGQARILYIPQDKKATCDRIIVSFESKQPQERSKPSMPAHWSIKKPFDESITGVDDLVIGRLIRVRVKAIKEMQINIDVAENLRGRIHITNVYDSYDDIKNKTQPLKRFSVHQMINVRILGWHDARTHQYLPISRASMTEAMLELSVKPSVLNSNELHELSLSDLRIDEIVTGFISRVNNDGLWVNLSPSIHGRVFPLHVSTDSKVVANLQKHYKIGTAVHAKVISVDIERKILDLSIRALSEDFVDDFDSIKLKAVYPGKVASVNDLAAIIQLSDSVRGRVYITDISDAFSPNQMRVLKKGQVVDCVVVNINKPNKQIDLSLRASDLGKNTETIDSSINDIVNIKVGSVLHGFVKHVADGGVFVSISRELTARVKIAELTDEFLKDWKDDFQIGQLVQGKILHVDLERKHIEMTLKSSKVNDEADSMPGLAMFHTGQKVKGTIKKVERYGVFIKIEGTNVSGLCHVSEISDSRITDISKVYSVGDPVKALVKSINTEKGKISFGLKASYFDDADMEVSELEEHNQEDLSGENMEMTGRKEDVDMDESKGDGDDEDSEVEDEDEDDEDGEDEDQDDDEDQNGENKDSDDEKMHVDGKSTGLSLKAGGVSWSGLTNKDKDDDDESDASEIVQDEEDDTGTASSKKNKKKKQKHTFQDDLTADLADKSPDSVADYERLLVANPNSSLLWVSYMAFQLNVSEVDKARAIGERALKTINFREEQEKINVWVALLNLENKFGSDVSVQEVFNRYVQMSDPKHAYLQLAQIYERSEKTAMAEDIMKQTIKKFGTSSKVWSLFGEFYLKQGRLDEARELLLRSTKSLPKRKHVKTISKFAQMEFNYGEAERGRTVFEGMLSQFPKRTDLWNIYIDMEIKYTKDASVIRNLFAKITMQNMPKKTMKHFFKRWLVFEKQYGSEKTVEDVRLRAIEYVERGC